MRPERWLIAIATVFVGAITGLIIWIDPQPKERFERRTINGVECLVDRRPYTPQVVSCDWGTP